MELPFAVSEEPEPEPPALPPRNSLPLNQFGNTDPYVSGRQQPSHIFSQQQQQPAQAAYPPQTPQSFDDDFTHVSVYESDEKPNKYHHDLSHDADVDILIDAGSDSQDEEANDSYREVLNDTALGGLHQGGDVLTVLLRDEPFVSHTETASHLAFKASEAKREGNLAEALEYHMQAAKLYQSIAAKVKDRNASMANSMLLLSQSQIKSAMVLKRIVRLSPEDLGKVFPQAESATDSLAPSPSQTKRKSSQKDRLRAAVRGALGSRHPPEADISDSVFLGRAKSTAQTTAKPLDETRQAIDEGPSNKATDVQTTNPVDDMMELERELRDMDMALDLGNSIGSLDALKHNRIAKASGNAIDGSFMVVPPGSHSYMSSSSMWGTASGHHMPSQQGSRMADVRARANRVQSKVSKSQHGGAIGSQIISPPLSQPTNSLESSWWGNPASASASIMASSILSVDGNSRGILAAGPNSSLSATGSGSGASDDSASTKQLMRLMDALKTLGDENATLMREVEDAEVARAEAKAAKAQMKRFQVEYHKRFAKLKDSLEKFRKEHAAGNADAATSNVVNSSNFVRAASASDQIQRQEQLIRKLTFDLKKEKEESKKKDAALRKYESFYKEVKARSAQKAAQRQQQQQQQPNLRQPSRLSRTLRN